MKMKSGHLPADQRRALIVQAVIDLAAEQIPSDITTAAMAKRMNLTQGALFRHFPSKDAIWHAVMDWVAEQLLARVDKASQRAESPVAALKGAFMAHIDFVAEHPGVPRILFGELQRAGDTPTRRAVQTLIRRYGQRLRLLIEQGKSQGELAKEVNTKAAVTLFIGTIQGLVMQSLLAGDIQRIRKDAPRVFAIFHRGIGSVR